MIRLMLEVCGSTDPKRGAFNGDSGRELVTVELKSAALTRRAGVRLGSSRGRVWVKVESTLDPEGSVEPNRDNFVAEGGRSLTGTRLAGLRLWPSRGGAVNTGAPKTPPVPGTLPGRAAVGWIGTRRAGDEIRIGLGTVSVTGCEPEDPGSPLVARRGVPKIGGRMVSWIVCTASEEGCLLGDRGRGGGALSTKKDSGSRGPEDVDDSGWTSGAKRLDSRDADSGDSGDSCLRDDVSSGLLSLGETLLRRSGEVVPELPLLCDSRAERRRGVAF